MANVSFVMTTLRLMIKKMVVHKIIARMSTISSWQFTALAIIALFSTIEVHKAILFACKTFVYLGRSSPIKEIAKNWNVVLDSNWTLMEMGVK